MTINQESFINKNYSPFLIKITKDKTSRKEFSRFLKISNSS